MSDYPFKAGQHAGATNAVCPLTNFVCRSAVPALVTNPSPSFLRMRESIAAWIPAFAEMTD
jgi:hypothetical protein